MRTIKDMPELPPARRVLLKAGESIEELAEDYGRSRSEIEEAIRCELWLDAA